MKKILPLMAVGILIIFVIVIAILSCGCTDTDKEPAPTGNENITENENITTTDEKIEIIKCGGINEVCCENKTCNFNMSCIENKCMNLTITNISTEKPKYTANEPIKISVSINSTSDVNNVSLRVYGITSRQKKHLIESSQIGAEL